MGDRLVKTGTGNWEITEGPQCGYNLVRLACNPGVIRGIIRVPFIIFVSCDLDFVNTNP